MIQRSSAPRRGTSLAFSIGVLAAMTLVGVPVARADGIGSDADVHVAQSLGGRELTVTIRRVGPVLGPLHVDDGRTAARIPFLVPAQVIPPWQKARDYGFFAAGALLIVSLGVALRARRNWRR